MSIIHFGGAPLLAALSIQFEINWPRFILTIVVLAALIGIVAQQMNESLTPKKKKDSPFSPDYTDRGQADDLEAKRYL
jgi:Na+-driven multidrug efflux pump